MHFPIHNQLFLTPTSYSKNCYQANTHYFFSLYEAVYSNMLTKNTIELLFSFILYRCTILHRISPYSQHSLALHSAQSTILQSRLPKPSLRLDRHQSHGELPHNERHVLFILFFSPVYAVHHHSPHTSNYTATSINWHWWF